MPPVLVIYTVGHSVHTAEAFVHLLETQGIRQLADVRTVPASRRYPHFTKAALDAYLAQHGITYRHFPALGGLRKPRPDSINTGWIHEGFRGYADYMQTRAFREGICLLEDFARMAPTVVMCAEAVWWQCHRRLLADALSVRGVSVRHIVSRSAHKPHELSEFAGEQAGEVIYPGLL